MDDSQAPHTFESWDDISLEESPTVVAPAEVDFLTPPPANSQLLDATTYRPGAAVAFTLLIGPIICALLSAITASVTSAISVWLAVALLLWLPALALAWALLKSVRISPETLTCWRPLGSAHTLSIAGIERIEQRGLRIIVVSRDGTRLSFAPLLLGQGAHLRRRLIQQVAPRTLAADLRAEAHTLENDLEHDATPPAAEDAVEGILSIRTPARWPTLTLALAVIVAAVAALAIWWLAWPLGVALGAALFALAGVLAYIGLWTAQDIFVSEKGALIHYRLLRRERDIFWAQAWLIEFTPGELALRIRSGHDVICAGPGLFAHDDAARLRDYMLRYATPPVEPLLARRKV